VSLKGGRLGSTFLCAGDRVDGWNEMGVTLRNEIDHK